jgi:hypothetical protein
LLLLIQRVLKPTSRTAQPWELCLQSVRNWRGAGKRSQEMHLDDTEKWPAAGEGAVPAYRRKLLHGIIGNESGQEMPAVGWAES